MTDSSIKFIQDKGTSINKLLDQGDVLAAPIRLASGTNIKVLEAMANGLPVVTTSVGIEGIEAKRGEEVIIADKPKEFADKTVELLADGDRCQKLGKAGQALVKNRYNWAEISKKLEKIYQLI